MGGVLRIEDLWEENVECVREGEVFTHDGRVVNMRSLIQRRWNWNKRAASLAAGYILSQSKIGKDPVLWLSRKKRIAQAMEMFKEVPDLLEILLNGMAQDAQREAKDAERSVGALHVELDRSIEDNGFTRSVLRALAVRLGCTVEELRDSTHFGHAGDEMWMQVQASKFDP